MCEDNSAMKRYSLKIFIAAWSIAILLSVAVSSRAQIPQAIEPTEQDLRIASLLVRLADRARSSSDPAFAARAQAQAATLLWPHDRDRSRAIFRRALDSLASASSARSDKPENTLSAAARQQLQAELLNQIAKRDPELAESIARSLAYSIESVKGDFSSGALAGYVEPQGDSASDAALFDALPARAEIEQRELLISVALQIVERDPHRAMALAQISLATGVSPNFGRLLLLMRGMDRVLADLLFSSAVARMEQAQSTALVDIHTLGSYLVSSAGYALGDSGRKQSIIRFLHLAFNQIMCHSLIAEPATGALRSADSELESSAIYFIERQLVPLIALYLPDRLAQLKGKINELNSAAAFERVIDPMPVQSNGPADAAREALAAYSEEERSALYARAALGWLAGGELNEAQKAALKITNRDMRDRVLIQIARRQTSAGRLDEAAAVSSRIEDDTARVGVLVRLAGAAISAKDRVRATELLNQAEREALKMSPSVARSQTLLTIVSSLSAFDVLRAFEVMQATVKAINSAGVTEEENTAPRVAPVKGADLYHLNFEGTLAVLARADFDRALLLAEQLASNEISVIAQLAVCRGGLAHSPAIRHAADEEEAETGINY